MERNHNDINPDWKRPPDWKYQEDWNSTNWKKRMARLNKRRQKLVQKYGFVICQVCDTHHTTLTFCCRKCNYISSVPKEEWEGWNEEET